jgi:hypothetical protein
LPFTIGVAFDKNSHALALGLMLAMGPDWGASGCQARDEAQGFGFYGEVVGRPQVSRSTSLGFGVLGFYHGLDVSFGLLKSVYGDPPWIYSLGMGEQLLRLHFSPRNPRAFTVILSLPLDPIAWMKFAQCATFRMW